MLNAVIEFARTRGMFVEAGFKPKTVRWLLVFSPHGTFLQLHDFEDKSAKVKGREFSRCPDLTQPEIVAAGEGCRPFLVDSLDSFLNWSKQDDDDSAIGKVAAKNTYFLRLLAGAASVVPELGPIAENLLATSVRADIILQLQELKAKPNDLGTIGILVNDQLRIIVEEAEWHDWWRNFRNQLGSDRKSKSSKGSLGRIHTMRCLLSGELMTPQPTHGKISGLSSVGGLPMGDALSSFDKDAFCSFGLEQGANAAMSEEMAATYVAAVNRLIKDKSTCETLVGTKVLFWYSNEVEAEEQIIDEVFNFGDAEVADSDAELNSETKTRQAESRAKRLLQSIRSGERQDLLRSSYYSLTISGNSGRVMVRDWMEGRFADLVQSISDWFDDLTIVSRHGDGLIRGQKLLSVLAAPVRELKDIQAPLVASLWRCAIRGRASPVPVTAVAQTLRRITLDVVTNQSPRHARLALLRMFLNRSGRKNPMTAELNPLENDPAYLSGRIMALIGRIQTEALGDVGAGVVQRYYAAASTAPALILGRLTRLTQIAHLPRISNPGLKIWFEKQLGEVWSALSAAPPKVMSLEQQTLFAMGYYHQMAHRGRKSDESSQGDK